MRRLLWFVPLLPALLAAAPDTAPAVRSEGERLLATAARLLGVGDKGAPTADFAGHWEALHALEGNGVMLRDVDPDVCAAAEAQSARATVRLLTSCHRDDKTSTLSVFVAD